MNAPHLLPLPLPLLPVAFPDYPVASLPLIPADFADKSWHNDACPYFYCEALGLGLFVDYPNPAERECGADVARFHLHNTRVTVGGMPSPVMESDDWTMIDAAISARLPLLPPPLSA